MTRLYISYLSSCIIVGTIASYIARRQGKNPTNWFLYGVLLNIVVFTLLMRADRKNKVDLGQI